MANVEHGHVFLGVVYLVDHPVDAHSDAPPVSACQSKTTRGPGVLAKTTNRITNPLVVRSWQPG